MGLAKPPIHSSRVASMPLTVKDTVLGPPGTQNTNCEEVSTVCEPKVVNKKMGVKTKYAQIRPHTLFYAVLQILYEKKREKRGGKNETIRSKYAKIR